MAEQYGKVWYYQHTNWLLTGTYQSTDSRTCVIFHEQGAKTGLVDLC